MRSRPASVIFQYTDVSWLFFFLAAGFRFTGTLVLTGVFLTGGGTLQTYKNDFMPGQQVSQYILRVIPEMGNFKLKHLRHFTCPPFGLIRLFAGEEAVNCFGK